ncbi:MAG: DUF4139 domain-containing protein [Pseudomonadota bacterium]|nr:DUF4139 domain-containing protein [Pseudomonadota bacterium]
MKKAFLPAALSLSALLMAFPALGAEGLALKRVMLSTGGVGYFEYEATVSGDTTLPLSVPLDQVNDILKSIVVYDDRGDVGEVSLPGKEPLRETFRSLPFSQQSLNSPADLLTALRGAEVRIRGSLTGRILSVTPEMVNLPDNRGSMLQHRLSIMTVGGLKQFILENTDSIEFVDRKLQAQVNEALTALSRDTAQDSRTLTVRLNGDGERTVRVAYVAEAPLWKTTYRLTVPQQGQGKKGQLQGWAVLENVSGEDWNNVDLTVASGNPVTFRQQLFDAYYVSRPEVPVEVFGRILPKVDQGAAQYADMDKDMDGRDMAEEAAFGRTMGEVSASSVERLAPATVAREKQMRMQGGIPAEMAPAPPPAPMPARIEAAASAEAATQVTFHMPKPVTVPRGHSVLLPIISRDVPVDPVSFYQYAIQGTDPLALVRGSGPSPHPLAAVRMTNDSDTGLPPGVLTLYERDAKSGDVSYVGDAQMAPLPAGEDRMVSFALDQKVRILRDGAGEELVADGRIADGILQLNIVRRDATTYTVTGAAKEDRTVLIEHPKYEGWTLVQPDPKSVQVTDSAWRIRDTVPAGKTSKITVVTELPQLQTFHLVDLGTGQLQYFAAAKRLSDKVRQALTKLAEYSATVEDRQRKLDEIQNSMDTLEQDQERLRENLKAVPKDSDVAEKYLKKLDTQEDALEDLDRQRTAARKALDKAKQERQEYVRSLKL